MSKKTFLKKLSIIAALCAVVLGSAIGPVAKADDNKPDHRIQISTLKREIDVDPGGIYNTSINIQNTGNESFTYKIETDPYGVIDGTYDDILTRNTDRTMLSNWITPAWETAELPAGQSIEVPLTIKVPKDVPAGGQYAVVTAQISGKAGDEKNTNVASQYRVGMLVFATVNGDTRIAGDIPSNDINGFMLNGPLTTKSVVHNTGNIHTDYIGVLEVSGAFDNKLLYTNADSPDKRTILPDSTRNNSITWEDMPAFGLYKVKQTVDFAGKKSVNEKIVFACPLALIIIVAVLILGLIIWAIVRAKERKKKKEV